MNDTTKAAILALARYQRSAHGLALFRANFYDGRPVIACHADDVISAVLERVMHTEPPVTVAVHFPMRHGEAEFTVFDLSPDTYDAIASEHHEQPVAGVTSTIGMLADSLSPGRQNVEFTWAKFAVSPFALSPA